MQIVLSNNRVVGYGDNFLCMGGTVINTVTGAKYDNATIAECDCVPSDIGRVGYEYKGGSFIPSAPFGMADNTGYIMEVCTSCATPRNSGVPVKNAKWETVDTIVFEPLTTDPTKTDGYLRDSDSPFLFNFDVSTDILKDYSQYRMVLKKGSTIKISKDGSGRSGRFYLFDIHIGRNIDDEVEVTIPYDCIITAGFVTSRIDADSYGAEFSTKNDCTQFTIEITDTFCSLNATIELQVRG